jgi:hypothetical protein
MKPPYFIDYGAQSPPSPIKRGDAWTVELFTFRSPAGEGAAFWDGLVVRSQLRSAVDGALAHEFDLLETVTEEDGVGILTLQLQIEPVASAAFAPGNCVGDIEVACDVFPNCTLVSFRVPVLSDVTHN